MRCSSLHEPQLLRRIDTHNNNDTTPITNIKDINITNNRTINRRTQHARGILLAINDSIDNIITERSIPQTEQNSINHPLIHHPRSTSQIKPVHRNEPDKMKRHAGGKEIRVETATQEKWKKSIAPSSPLCSFFVKLFSRFILPCLPSPPPDKTTALINKGVPKP